MQAPHEASQACNQELYSWPDRAEFFVKGNARRFEAVWIFSGNDQMFSGQAVPQDSQTGTRPKGAIRPKQWELGPRLGGGGRCHTSNRAGSQNSGHAAAALARDPAQTKSQTKIKL
jgi:hypothetical protein